MQQPYDTPMNFSPTAIKGRIDALKVQMISHQQSLQTCERDISTYKSHIQTEEREKEVHRFHLHQIERELGELKNTLDNESNKPAVAEAAMYHGGADGLEIMDDPARQR